MDKLEKYKEVLKETVIHGDISDDETEKLMHPLKEVIKEIKPKKLFRFRSCNENNVDAFLKDLIFFSEPKNFNDPHDCFSFVDANKMEEIKLGFTSDAFENEIKQIRESSHLIKEAFTPNILPAIERYYEFVKSLTEEETENLVEEVKRNFSSMLLREFESLAENSRKMHRILARELTYAACLSEEIDSTLMWAHYSDYHKGFALEYDVVDVENAIGKCQNCKNACNSWRTIGLYPIVYGTERYNATEFEIEVMKWGISQKYGFTFPFITPDKLFQIKTNSYKCNDWKYEKEWRLIFNCNHEHPQRKDEKVTPKAIYFGTQMLEINKEILKELAENKNLDIFQMYIDDESEEFKLSFRKLN